MARITGYSYIPKVYKNQDTNQFVQVYLPMVPIRISTDLRQISPSFDAVADSGSERNLFPMFVAEYLRIDFGKTKPNKVYGIGEDYIKVYPARINILLGTKSYKTEADFSHEQNIPILGRNGFFNLF